MSNPLPSMTAPAEDAQEKINDRRASGGTSSQKRRPPKLRPPKLGKRPISEDEQQLRGSEQRENGVSEGTGSNYPQETSDSVALEQSQGSVNYDQPTEEAEVNSQPARHRLHRVVRQTSTSRQSSEPEQFNAFERQQTYPDSAQTQTDDARVQQVLSSPPRNLEVGQLGHAVPGADGTAVNQVTETTETVKSPEGNDQLKLRLDLNLDIEIQLKAKIQGDLTLQLLQ